MNPNTRAPCLHAIADRPRATWTPEAFRARALELLATHPRVWAYCRRLGYEVDDCGRLVWLAVAVPSATTVGTVYRVRYDVASDSAACNCLDAQRGQPCFHAGVALAYGRDTSHDG